jgi:hypothetical protein
MESGGYKLYHNSIDTAEAVLPRLHLACYKGTPRTRSMLASYLACTSTRVSYANHNFWLQF